MTSLIKIVSSETMQWDPIVTT
uniref:Uncharacterized protein n=1 Tax=Anguilla anguilla TaxID=7936 RepID=A0A0E9RVV8_ANGAN